MKTIKLDIKGASEKQLLTLRIELEDVSRSWKKVGVTISLDGKLIQSQLIIYRDGRGKTIRPAGTRGPGRVDARSIPAEGRTLEKSCKPQATSGKP